MTAFAAALRSRARTDGSCAFLGPRAPSPAPSTDRCDVLQSAQPLTCCSHDALMAGEGARGPSEELELCGDDHCCLSVGHWCEACATIPKTNKTAESLEKEIYR